MGNKQYTIIKGEFGHVRVVDDKGYIECSFDDLKNAQDYVKFKNNQSVQKAKIDEVINGIKNRTIGRYDIVKMLEDLKK